MALQADGNYLVRKGDTLYAIAFRFGRDYREIARWNGIHAPYLIHPGQVLSVTPPSRLASKRPVAQAPVRSAPPVAPGAGPKVVKPEAPPPAPIERAATVPGATAVASTLPLTWKWPVEGAVLRGFVPNDPARNGLDISGRVGQPVYASGAGTVVYSGSGLIGYGELIIIKHDERLLSAYAYNRIRLVSEGEVVSVGQKIAEMGRNDRREALLHFEIRSDGRPVDPMQYLPPR
jgi:lipoprotein NlpD